ncbi:MAG: 3-hydroxyacyl-CoA dehydrogenase NAD-binding domain-containing protein, partial [Candidatus Berkiella sp.]
MTKILIRKAAVLGAGVMGAQIAAHLTNAGILTILYDLPSQKGGQNEIVESSIKSLTKLKPSPLAMESIEKYIIAANYEDDLEKLNECDLVIEAISERFDYKQSLYQKVSPFLNAKVIFASNTSGLSIHKLAQTLPEHLRSRFCGIHFFNPPRYMKLVEVIPHQDTNQTLLSDLETFLVSRLGKGVVIAKDTPNFIGNRIGVFSFLSALYHSQELGLAPDLIDALTGPLIGRPKSATFRTMDVVGLDTMAHVVNTLKQDLKDDPWASYFELPTWITELINKGALGQKRGVGVYKKVNDEIQVWDLHDNIYRSVRNHVSSAVLLIMKEPVEKRINLLATSLDPQAQFLWRHFRDLFHYCAYHLQSIANTVQDVDLALRWGYGWSQGPFEIWQSATWSKVSELISNEISNKHAMVDVALPGWVNKLSQGPYQEGKAYNPNSQTFESSDHLPVYRRQYFPESLLTSVPFEGKTIFETPSIRMWTLDDNIPIVSFSTKKNSITTHALEGLIEAVHRAQKDYDALVFWQRNDVNFSVGANLKEILEGFDGSNIAQIQQTV